MIQKNSDFETFSFQISSWLMGASEVMFMMGISSGLPSFSPPDNAKLDGKQYPDSSEINLRRIRGNLGLRCRTMEGKGPARQKR